MTQKIQARLLDVEQSAIYLGIAEKTLRNRIGPRAKDKFPVRPKRIGRKVLFDRRDLDAYIDELPTTP